MRAMLGGARKAPPSPTDGRLGWFEGLREDRLCGWTYAPDRPGFAFDVTLTTPAGAMLTIRADRLRADLQALGVRDAWHGFSIPVASLPGADRGVTCTWSDLALHLPGSPWSPRRKSKRFRVGPVVTVFDEPNPGDPRLTGRAFDRRAPLRRIRLLAKCADVEASSAVASLYRVDQGGDTGDGYHGFILALPAPLRLLAAGVEILDADHGEVLARLGARSL